MNKIDNIDIDIRLINRNIIRIGDYISHNKQLLWQCVLCNHQWLAFYSNILHSGLYKKSGRGTNCPNCGSKDHRYDYAV